AQADLRAVDMRGGRLSSCVFVEADLEGAWLPREMPGCTFEEVRWGRAPGEEPATRNMAGADFDGQELAGRDLRGADLSSASLRAADLRGADLRDANLENAQ